jgi:glycosyltransferase involved in cell wall biosynthesis
MSADWQQRVWSAMADRVPDVAAFFPVSSYYAELMKERMQIPDDKLHVVPIGIDPEVYSLSETKSEIPVIGYLSRVAESLGFGILVDAFILLKQKPHFAQLQLHVTGGKTGDDEKFILAQQKKLTKNGFLQDVHFYDEYTGQHRIDFLKKCSAVSVPVPDGEAFGMFIIEALACGVPVVQPNTGAFPELVNATGGGIIYQPNTPEKLAETLESLLSEPAKLHELGQNGRKAIEEKYTVDHMAEKMLEVYTKLLPLC